MLLSEYISAIESHVVRQVVPKGAIEIMGAACDSRKVAPGYVFCAIKGAKTDGAAFVPQAIAGGALAIVTDSEMEPVPGIAWIQVDNGYHAMARIAQAAYGFPAKSMRLWAVTGTNGKTTSAYLLKNILEAAGRKVGMVGTIVYDTVAKRIPADRTTPTPFEVQALLAEMRDSGATDCVLEMSSHALHQERLADAKFSGAIFTNLTQDHLDYHGTMEEYFRCKAKLFLEMLLPDGIAVINEDDEYGRRLLEMKMENRRWVGQSFRSDAAGDFVVDVAGVQEKYATGMVGKFNLYNASGAVLLARHAGISRDVVADACANFTGAPGRLQPVRVKSGAMAYVDYAHTDDAIAKALAALRPICRGRLIIVFGCGGDRDRTKRPKMAVAASKADVIFITSDNPRTERPEDIISDILPGFPPETKYTVVVDRKEAILQATGETVEGDVVLVAGKGHEDYQEINGVKHYFSDAEILKDC